MKKLFLKALIVATVVVTSSLEAATWIKAGTKETSLADGEVTTQNKYGDGYYDYYIENQSHAEINCPKTCGGNTWVDKKWKNEGTTSYCYCNVKDKWVESGYGSSIHYYNENLFYQWGGLLSLPGAPKVCPTFCKKKGMHWYGTAGEGSGESWKMENTVNDWVSYCRCLDPIK